MCVCGFVGREGAGVICSLFHLLPCHASCRGGGQGGAIAKQGRWTAVSGRQRAGENERRDSCWVSGKGGGEGSGGLQENICMPLYI